MRYKWTLKQENRHFLRLFCPSGSRIFQRVPFYIYPWHRSPEKGKKKSCMPPPSVFILEKKKKLALIQMRTEQPKCITIETPRERNREATFPNT